MFARSNVSAWLPSVQLFMAETHDDMEPGYFDADESVYWKKDGESNHVIDVREPLSLE